jgi:hypothetical protein
VTICTYHPFDVKVCFNGHEWAKQQSRQAGIGFEALSNGFFGTSPAFDRAGERLYISYPAKPLKSCPKTGNRFHGASWR